MIRGLRGPSAARLLTLLFLANSLVACTDTPLGPRPATLAVTDAPRRSVAVGRTIPLGSLGGDPALTSARAISENGIVVGTAATASGVMHAFLWTDTSGMLDLGAPGGKNSTSIARGVSSNGIVVGEGTDDLTGETHAYRWTTTVVKTTQGRKTAVGMNDLGAPGATSTAAAVNASGWAVGQNNGHAYLWNPSGLRGAKNGDAVLDSRGGPQSQAYAINDLGQIAGTFVTPAGPHAFFATPQLVLKDLGTAGGTASEARAMNAAGQMVGWITTLKSTMPFIWSEQDGMTLLETVQDAKIEATAINSLGEVAGNIFARTGSTPFFWSREGRIIQEISGLTASLRVFGMNRAHQIVGSDRIVPFTPNKVPVAAPVPASTWENAPVTFTLPAGSGAFDDTIYTYAFSSSSGPLSKTAITGTGPEFTYTPGFGTAGVVTLSYVIQTKYGATSDPSTVTIAVKAADRPVARDLTYSVDPLGTIQIEPPGVDAAGEPLVYTLTSGDGSKNPPGGLVKTSTTPWTYTAPAGFSGVATFQYAVTNASGLVADAPATITITVCPFGTYDGGAGCVAFMPGGPGGPTLPTPCVAGTYGPAGSTPCTPAPAGTYVSTAGATIATPCPTGTYQPLVGQMSCLITPAGGYDATVGSIAAMPCPAGSYQALAGQTSCFPAPLGSYVDVAGAKQPTPCAAGLTTRALGSASATACVAFTASEIAAHAAAAVSAGTIIGVGSSATSTVNEWLNKLDLASGEIAKGQTRPACNHLYQAYATMDPTSMVRVTGSAAPTIAAQLRATYTQSGCVAIMPNALPF